MTVKAYCIEHGDVRFAPLPTSQVAAPVANVDSWCKVCLDRHYRSAEANVTGKPRGNLQLTELWTPANPVIILDLSWNTWFRLCMN